MKKCFLILAHKNVDHIYQLAYKFSEANFYIHLDLKNNNKIENKSIKNVYFIDQRIDIKWAGFSMVQATLNLIEYAMQHDPKNEYFHLISGDDVLLNNTLTWSDSSIYMECIESKGHRYRVRFDTPHADTHYQRTLFGKLLTQAFKILDKILSTKEKIYFGSQWFSIRRAELKTLRDSISIEDLDFFRKKLCPDEHFFQYLVEKNNLLDNISKQGNKRFIVFDPNYLHGSSPIFLNYSQLKKARDEDFWFARKVDPKVMQEFYLLSKDE